METKKIIQIENISKQDFYNFIESIIDDKLDALQTKDERLSVHEVAQELGVHEITVRNYVKTGKLPAEKIGRRVYIKRNDLDHALLEVKSLKYKR